MKYLIIAILISGCYGGGYYGYPAVNSPASSDNTVYSPDECIGPVIMGECKGTILPKPGYHEKCYGTWLNGQCIGPQF